MESKDKRFAFIRDLRVDCAKRQKKGLHIIISSVVIWGIIMMVHISPLPIEQKNLYTFCASAPLFPLSILMSKLLRIDFQSKDNPLTQLGIFFTVNQMIYLLIAMWVYTSMPDKMLMVYAMIFGAHLMPYSWLYLSRGYLMFSIVIPITALLIGCIAEPFVLTIVMLCYEILFSIVLFIECRKLQ